MSETQGIDDYLAQFTPMDEMSAFRPELAHDVRGVVTLAGVEDYRFQTNIPGIHEATDLMDEHGDPRKINFITTKRVLADSGLIFIPGAEPGAVHTDGKVDKNSLVIFGHEKIAPSQMNSIVNSLNRELGAEPTQFKYSPVVYHSPRNREVSIEEARAALDKVLMDPEHEMASEIARAHIERVKKAAQISPEA